MMNKGWLVIDEDTHRLLQYHPDEEEVTPEPPISNDTGVLQFHIQIKIINKPGEYPKVRITEVP